MEIVYRNFMTLLSAGAFSTVASVEPMSKFKWEQLLTLASTYEVADYMANGIISTATSNDRLIPKDIVENVYANYDDSFSIYRSSDGRFPDNHTPDNHTPDNRTPFIAGKTSTNKFAYFQLNRRLKRIVNDEIHSIDTSITSLTLLYMIIDNINDIIADGINFRIIIDLGQYLRRNGDKIDFVKTEQWLRTLGITKPANLVGSYLVTLFGFTESEVQFMSRPSHKAMAKAVFPLRYTLVRASKEPDVRDYKEKLTRKRHLSDTRVLSRTRLFPAEVVSRFLTGVVRSLANIEE